MTDPKRPDAPVTEEHRNLSHEIWFAIDDDYNQHGPEAGAQLLANYAEQVEARATAKEHANHVQFAADLSARTNYMQQIPGGVCFAHGPYTDMQCPLWPACATDPQRDEYKKLGLQRLASDPSTTLRSILRQLREKREKWIEAVALYHRAADVLGSMGQDSRASTAMQESFQYCADALLPLIREGEEAPGEK